MIDNYKTHPEYFGYFDEPGQREPAFDPGQSVPCLICEQPWTPNTVRTITFVVTGVNICYFYRVHRACHDGLGSDEQREEFEGRIVDSVGKK